MDQGRLRVAVVGLGFGAEFLPIYLDHPDVQSVAVCDSDPTRLDNAARRFGIKKLFSDVADVVDRTRSTPCTWYPASRIMRGRRSRC